ncbi:hypothetical protein MMC12_006764 [Toensbergia leucococca]|nr:hypothetical protein [Toensbergia leucococca]
MRFSLVNGLVLAITTVAIAFQHLPGAADGIYLHSYDASGNPMTEYLGTNVSHLQATRQRRQYVQLDTRKKKPPKVPGSEGVNCNSSAIIDRDDLSGAESQLGFACDNLDWWYHAISSVYLTAVAYACDYGDGNHCSIDTITSDNVQLNEGCGSNEAGWFAVQGYLYSTGRTSVGDQFCF